MNWHYKRNSRLSAGLLALAATGISGCNHDDGTPFGLYDQRIAGARPLVKSFEGKDFSPITPSELRNIIDNSYTAVPTSPSNGQVSNAATTLGVAEPRDAPPPGAGISPATSESLGDAISRFSNNIAWNDNEASLIAQQMSMRSARNSVVGQLTAISNQLCGEYEESLKEKSSNFSFGLGSLATAFGGAGAIFTNGTSSIFSGLAGVASGVNAEYNKDFFQGIATSIIIPGIERQRTALAQDMATKECFGITTYPLPLAIADVIRYHNACTMDKGISATSQTVSQSGTGGLASLASNIALVEAAHQAIKNAGAGTTGGSTTNTSSSAAGSSSSASTALTTPPPLGATVTLTECQPLDKNGDLQMLPAAATAPSVADIARVQLELMKKGYDIGMKGVDGIMGNDTISAIKKFQAAQNPALPQSGSADSATIAALGAAAPSPMPDAATTNKAIIKQVQEKLASTSPSVKQTGQVDTATIAGLIVYQDQKALPLTGIIDQATLSKLGVSL